MEKYFKVAVFALIYLNYVANGQNGKFTNGNGYFNSSSTVLDFRLNFSQYSSSIFNRTYFNCLSTLKKPNNRSYEMSVNCNECTKPCLPISTTESGCSEWSSWSMCSVTCGNGTQTRVKICTGTNCTQRVDFNTTKCNTSSQCQEPIAWTEWSPWSNCSVTCGNGTQTRVKLCIGNNCTNKADFNTTTCNTTKECLDPIAWTEWSPWSNCSVTCGNGTKTRVKLCIGNNCTKKADFNTTTCNTTQECLEGSTQANRREAFTDDAQNLTNSHIVIVAIACFLIGILVAAIVIILYMKRKQQGCFSHNNKRVEAGSRTQSGPRLENLTKRAISNEYESEDNENENKAVEISYQSLDFDQISKDQQTYDQYKPKPHFQHSDNKPSFGHQIPPLGNGKSANAAPSKIENVYEYARDGQDNENVSQECKPSSLEQQETRTVIENKVREVLGEQWNTDHEYSVLEPVDKARKVLGTQSDPDHEYVVLESVTNPVSNRKT